MDHTQETSGRTAHSPGDTIMEQSQAIERRREHRTGSPYETNEALSWFSSLQERMRSKSTPFYLFGLGLAAGGLSILWSKQRKRSILMRDFSGVAKEIRPKRQDDESLHDVGL
ncbi:MAG: hypothetical protein VR64_21915 [Desulfatitalea sp. BRH_c12]|nr:MAG: hypothetical protein VR64_21915 [Desulfatitalea sp. BRH_c12]